jgi:beta-lactamase regulating signal transducer with metallopeptidase domain
MLAILAESALRSLVLGSIVWVGLNLLRVRNPHVHMTSWAMVLAASVLMPLLMHWTTVTILLDPLPAPSPEKLWPAQIPLSEPLSPSLPSESGTPGVARGENVEAINWWGLATVIYALVSAVLLLRLAIGIYLTWRLVRAARPMSEPMNESWSELWASHSDVRVSDAIGGPVTFGSTIVLPPQWVEWDLPKCQAVLAHEGAHVANRDFYILLLASLNRAVFWFSPFAWWQLIRLAELAEIISDAWALEVLEDRLSYAEILLDLMRKVQQAPAGLEMARAGTIRARLERILGATMAPARVGWRKRFWIAAAILPVALVSAGTIAYKTQPVSSTVMGDAGDATTAVRKLQRVSFYSFGRTSIFGIFGEGDELFGQLSGQRKLRLSPEGDGTYSYPAAAGRITFAVGDERRSSELKFSQNGRDSRAARIAEISGQRMDPDALLDSYVGWYELEPYRVLAVTRDADQLYVQETGRSKLRVAALSADAFSGEHDDLVIFLRDDQAGVTRVLFQEPVSGARIAPRLDIAKARTVEERFARRIAEVPDRFRGQAPQAGSKEAALRGIADMQRGTPNYERMSAQLAAKIRHQAAELQSILNTLGEVESIFFRGVGPGGYDIYGVKFSKGLAEFRILLGADSKVDDAIFRADGNEGLGDIVACSSEQGLKSPANTAPIHVVFYNVTGSNIRLYGLDAEGKRTAQSVIGENISTSVLTTVDSPWVVADASGACLEIVLPGQRTRYNTIEETGPDGQLRHATSRRTAPMAGSEEVLRQYIEALARGQPDYDRMTPEVATQTRQQLPFDQAILGRLGELRAMSFRGVTGMGNDIYMAHFANGTAEWRIGLAKDGTIGRIALGPQ